MGQYDEFDLDIKKEKTNGASPAAATGKICETVLSAIINTIVFGCTGDCLSTNCGTATGCSQNTCTCYC